MTSLENEELEDQALCESDVKSIDQLSVIQYVDWDSLFILFEYFQKYLYKSAFKMTTFYFYSSTFFGQCFILYFLVVFSSVTKLTRVQFLSTFYTTDLNVD